MHKKILILGANGFIGVSLVAALLKNPEVVVYAMDLTGDRLAEMESNKNLHFQVGDITKETVWVKDRIAECDMVLPLVAIANPAIYVTDPLKIFELDFEANLAIVRECVRHKTWVIFPSTSEVYGMSSDQVFDEEKSPLTQGPINKPRWIYSCVKQLMDRIIYAYGERDGLPFTLFRPFNWIGPLQDDPRSKSARAIPSFLGNIMRGEDLVLVDGGKQRRAFTYIDDGIGALLKIIENKNGAADGRIFNIGNPNNDYSIRELAEKMLALAKTYPAWREQVAQVKIISKDAKEYYGEGYQDLEHRVPSIENARKYLGWGPKVTLNQALKLILDYHLG